MIDYAAIHGEKYFTEYGGGNSYLNETTWGFVFRQIAAHLMELKPLGTVLDAGCATGYLVEALRERGVAAWGIDFSPWAYAHRRPAVADFIRCQRLQEPLHGPYDLVVCIEVLEHIPPKDAKRCIANLCAGSDDVIFSSTSDDVATPEHCNVREQAYWINLFAEQGYFEERDAEGKPTFDGGFICEWAHRFRKR